MSGWYCTPTLPISMRRGLWYLLSLTWQQDRTMVSIRLGVVQPISGMAGLRGPDVLRAWG